MREDSLTLSPLNWFGLVDEAIRRRKVEGLTQKSHAALANVSVPTMISFDRKELTLSLGKALSILRVVGLTDERPPATSQDTFIQAADLRWAELVSTLEPNDPARHPHGGYIFDYHLDGVSIASTKALLEALRIAGIGYSGWPSFLAPNNQSRSPYIHDGLVECWMGRAGGDTVLYDAAHTDFWRATLDGRLVLRRGYQEDSADGLPPATAFDLILPIWRVGETLLHAHHFAEELEIPPQSTVEFRVHYDGLAGRTLTTMSNPQKMLFEDYRCRIKGVGKELTCQVGRIREDLPQLVHELLRPVYDAFDNFQLPLALVEAEIAALIANRRRR